LSLATGAGRKRPRGDNDAISAPRHADEQLAEGSFSLLGATGSRGGQDGFVVVQAMGISWSVRFERKDPQYGLASAYARVPPGPAPWKQRRAIGPPATHLITTTIAVKRGGAAGECPGDEAGSFSDEAPRAGGTAEAEGGAAAGVNTPEFSPKVQSQFDERAPHRMKGIYPILAVCAGIPKGIRDTAPRRSMALAPAAQRPRRGPKPATARQSRRH